MVGKVYWEKSILSYTEKEYAHLNVYSTFISVAVRYM